MTIEEIISLAESTFPQRKFTSGVRRLLTMQESKIAAAGPDRTFFFIEKITIGISSRFQPCDYTDSPLLQVYNSLDPQGFRIVYCPEYNVPNLTAGTSDSVPLISTKEYFPEIFVDQMEIQDPVSVGMQAVIMLVELVP